MNLAHAEFEGTEYRSMIHAVAVILTDIDLFSPPSLEPGHGCRSPNAPRENMVAWAADMERRMPTSPRQRRQLYDYAKDGPETYAVTRYVRSLPGGLVAQGMGIVRGVG